MGADRGALLDDDDRQLAAGRVGELLQPDRGGKPRWPRADDDDVELHRLSGGFVGRQLGCGLGLGHFFGNLFSRARALYWS